MMNSDDLYNLSYELSVIRGIHPIQSFDWIDVLPGLAVQNVIQNVSNVKFKKSVTKTPA